MQGQNISIEGVIDCHVHFAPDAYIQRSLDLFDLLEQAKAKKMGGLVIKSHDYMTAPLAALLQKRAESLKLYGGMVLNFEVGGFNVHSVKAAIELGAKVIWMPTFSSMSDKRERYGGEGLSVLDTSGNIKESVCAVLSLISEHDLILATGHLTGKEIFPLVESAQKMGVKRIIINHPLRAPSPNLSVQEQISLAKRGAILEQCLVHSTLSASGKIEPPRFADVIRSVGFENCIMATDFGQHFNPSPVAAMEMGIKMLAEQRFSSTEIDTLVKINPAKLLE